MKTETVTGSPNSEVDQALKRIEEQLSLDEGHLEEIDALYNDNENSHDFGLTMDEQSYNNIFKGYQGSSNN